MIAFVILNYKSFDDTLNCIESIKKLDTNFNNKIIVVDNASIDNESIRLKISESCDDLICLQDNIGFAKGNNEGINYAKEKYNPDFICVLNSDIIIEQNDFIEKIYDLYKKYNFDILGPKILPIDSNSVNPFPVYDSLEKVDDRIRYTKKMLKIYNNFFLRNLLCLYLKIKQLFRKNTFLLNGQKDKLNVALHGCALIFSKKYLDKYKDAIYDGTFLFHEEEFLYYRIKTDNLISLYSPEIELIHKEGQSLSREYKNYKKEIFRYEQILTSLELLKKIMKNKMQI